MMERSCPVYKSIEGAVALASQPKLCSKDQTHRYQITSLFREGVVSSDSGHHNFNLFKRSGPTSLGIRMTLILSSPGFIVGIVTKKKVSGHS